MEWYPTPSYLVKRRVILEYLNTCSGTHILEVGCGCGDLLHVLQNKGFTGVGIDISEEALVVAVAGFSNTHFTCKCCTPGDLTEKFDIVIASEVMEHHQDDMLFLSQLRDRLHDQGHLLLTVPAHIKKWGPNDDFCGHVRRYERNDLFTALQSAGFTDVIVYSYGVPIYNIMKPFYDIAIQTEASLKSARMEKTAESGGMFLMKGAERLFRILFNDVTMYPFYLLQRLFYRTDIGMGYFVAARKKELM
jgi:2-polyprenyl-3-methyl-5-hydroxy-6-metoxy-1,4-benzoquinol methylase